MKSLGTLSLRLSARYLIDLCAEHVYWKPAITLHCLCLVIDWDNRNLLEAVGVVRSGAMYDVRILGYLFHLMWLMKGLVGAEQLRWQNVCLFIDGIL